MKNVFVIWKGVVNRNNILLLVISILLFVASACQNNKKEEHSQHQQGIVKEKYTCPMHPEITGDEPGNCPICGMKLVITEKGSEAIEEISLNILLKPTNEFVISSLPMISPKQSDEPVEIEVLGYTVYNTSSIETISARVSGRIEKLYIKYRYQKIRKGERIMDIYSPELLTAQQNLLFLLKNDKENKGMIESAKERLLLLGLSDQQLQQVIQSGNPLLTVTIYSNDSGHIHEAGSLSGMPQSQTSEAEAMKIIKKTTQELSLKEGMYVQKGQVVFSIYDPNRLWILLNIYSQDQAYVKVGDKAIVIPESRPDKEFSATIKYIEPFFREGSKTIAARINYDNSTLKLPIGSQVRATIFSGIHTGLWLPKEAILSLGFDKVVFLKTEEGLKVHKIETGHVHEKILQVTSGLTEKDSVAANAQYLMDSESFVKIKDE